MPVTVETDKPINLNQLNYEISQALGRGPWPLRAVQGKYVRCLDDDMPEEWFAHAIAHHVADEAWLAPYTGPEPEPENEEESRDFGPPAPPPARPGLLRRIFRPGA